MISYPDLKELSEYQKNYITLVPAGMSLMDALDDSYSQLFNVLARVDEHRSNFRYQEDKWNIKTVLMHISDTERIFQYRALCISRGEQQNLLSFDENNFAQNSFADRITYAKLLEEYMVVAKGLHVLFEHMNEANSHLIGMANGVKVSAATIGFLTAGHRLHHLKILTERYLV